ncbi:putative photosynthetic complex assembly protein PuhE [Sandarakinorhabdus limnophila]|uniref:putative photosynthetic complex assembly protein PuhE n=1 Tax=Sandarakinorhabdus limnophila TaxID=210512 RepID=UPI0026F121F6|nr:putative photosynthetic complex assembly protein PuhE [Sandarakinorhabdus limnophila]MCM0032968.1 putative photosynthetic complex assembly protein PuhE [Sandarakinorhabdus limnophila]
MTEFALPLLFATVLWFVATGFVLWLDKLPSHTWPVSITLASVASGFAMGGIIATAEETSAWAAYVAFACALVLWGWHELSFLMGFVTGPNRNPCPPDARGWRRFRLAASTLIYHEVAMFVCLLVMAAATWGKPNQTATLTFLLLFVMRLSAKFNIFAGVPHLSTEMMPDHMRYLASYFRIAPPRWFFILSVSGIAVLAAWLADLALSSRGGIATGYALAFALVALAFLEHGFLVVPWQDTAIFRWAMPEQARQRLQKSTNEPVTMSAQTDTNPLAVRQNAVQ